MPTAIAVWCEKNKRTPAPARGKLTVFAQLCNLIPGHMVARLARTHGIDSMCRTFSAWSHVVSLLFAQLTHAIGLNDVCDNLRHHRGLLARVRGATAPSRNNLFHANKRRGADMARDLFWEVLATSKPPVPASAPSAASKDWPAASSAPFTWSTRPRYSSSPPALTGRGTAAKKPPPSATCAWTSKACSRAS